MYNGHHKEKISTPTKLKIISPLKRDCFNRNIHSSNHWFSRDMLGVTGVSFLTRYIPCEKLTRHSVQKAAVHPKNRSSASLSYMKQIFSKHGPFAQHHPT